MARILIKNGKVISPTGVMEEGDDASGRVPASLAGLDRSDARAKDLRRMAPLGSVDPCQAQLQPEWFQQSV